MHDPACLVLVFYSSKRPANNQQKSVDWISGRKELDAPVFQKLAKIQQWFTQMNSLDIHEETPVVDVVIETPRGSFLKRGSTGKLDFISPLPCPFNYGSIPAFIGLDGDYLDAIVLGPRLPWGSTVSIYAWGSIGMIDGGEYEDKLICSQTPVSNRQKQLILWFFMIYAKAKYLLNLIKGRKGHNSCEGWHDAVSAFARAMPSQCKEGS